MSLKTSSVCLYFNLQTVCIPLNRSHLPLHRVVILLCLPRVVGRHISSSLFFFGFFVQTSLKWKDLWNRSSYHAHVQSEIFSAYVFKRKFGQFCVSIISVLNRCREATFSPKDSSSILPVY